MLDDASIDARPYSGCRQSNRLPCIDDASRRHANSQLETVRFIAHSWSTRSQWEIHTSFFSSAFMLLLHVSTCVSSLLLTTYYWRFILKSFIDNTLLPALTVFALFAYLVSVFK